MRFFLPRGERTEAGWAVVLLAGLLGYYVVDSIHAGAPRWWGLGIMSAFIGLSWRTLRVRVEASGESLRIVNFFRSRSLAWGSIDRFILESRSRGASARVLDLTGHCPAAADRGTALRAYAVGVDGRRYRMVAIGAGDWLRGTDLVGSVQKVKTLNRYLVEACGHDSGVGPGEQSDQSLGSAGKPGLE
jgi:hypothetical protein